MIKIKWKYLIDLFEINFWFDSFPSSRLDVVVAVAVVVVAVVAVCCLFFFARFCSDERFASTCFSLLPNFSSTPSYKAIIVK
jgi:hypothetical protein